MRATLLDILRCPETGQRLAARDAVERDGDIESGDLVTEDGLHRYPIVNGIPRFVPSDNYAASFGFQWHRFGATQLDSTSGVPISRDRFLSFSGWTPAELAGKRVLDVGCGAGRFTEIALACGARVVAIDYSSAVDVCKANHGTNPRLDVVQADIYRLPFAPEKFDYVYCFGVLQHTPDVAAAFKALPPQLAPGGSIAVDIYPRLRLNFLWPKYWLRPITRHIAPPRLFRLVERVVPRLLPVSRLLGRVPGIGRKLRHVIPVMNYEGVLPLSERQLEEWAVLDTFDMLSPTHDHPQNARTLRRWFAEAGLTEVWVGRPGFLVGRGRKPTRG
jgi:SAM-dependent methyltransferase